MNKPDFITPEDWKLVNKYCIKYSVNPYIVVGIGWHETQWGKLGWGRYGYILGVGCYTETEVDEKYKGLEKQVEFATQNLYNFVSWIPTENMLIKFNEKIWRSASPVNWGKKVYAYTMDFLGRYGQDLYSCLPPPDYVKLYLLRLYEKEIVYTPYGDNTFYRILTILSKLIP